MAEEQVKRKLTAIINIAFDRYLKQAEDVENAGFHRFAATLRELADSYSRQASRIREEHNNESSI